MIDPKELRIGNWVMDVEPWNHLFQIKGINIQKAENGWEYRPIQLTPEILEWCKFKRVGNDDDYIVWRIGEGGYYEELCTSGKDLFFYGNSGPIGMPLKHLHQLQNLFFALTGEELEFKPSLATAP